MKERLLKHVYDASKDLESDYAYYLCQLNSYPFKKIEKYLDTMNTYLWSQISYKSMLDIEDIIKYKEHIDHYQLSQNENLRIEHVLALDWIQWNYSEVSRNKFIGTVENIEKYPHIPWCYSTLSRYLPISFIEKHIDKEWCFFMITDRDDLTFETIKKFPHKDWNWYIITYNVHMSTIEQNPNFPWHYISLLCNPNLTLGFIKRNPSLILIENEDMQYLLKRLNEDFYNYITDDIDVIYEYLSFSKGKLIPTEVIDIIVNYLYDCF